MALSDPVELKDDDARKFLQDLEHPVHSERRAKMLKKASEAAQLLKGK
jgi:hypothetical protein